jgi:hypothetical protein
MSILIVTHCLKVDDIDIPEETLARTLTTKVNEPPSLHLVTENGEYKRAFIVAENLVVTGTKNSIL